VTQEKYVNPGLTDLTDNRLRERSGGPRCLCSVEGRSGIPGIGNVAARTSQDWRRGTLPDGKVITDRRERIPFRP
jgi:hypothetical protein